MIVREEDRGKVIALVIGICLMAVLFLWRMHSVLSPDAQDNGHLVVLSGKNKGAEMDAPAPPSQSPAPASNPVAVATPAPSPTAGVSSTSSPNDPNVMLAHGDQDQIPAPTLVASGFADPFRTVVSKDPPPAPPQSKVRLVPKDLSMNMAPLPPASLDKPSGLEISHVPLPTVSGILGGENAVAVLNLGAVTYVVKKGDKFGDGFSVISITPDHVTVKQGTITSTLGMSQ